MACSKFNGFSSDAARVKYAQRVAVEIIGAMQTDPKLAEDFLVRGRIGLAQMSDQQLFETGLDAWGVTPLQEEVRNALH